MKSLLADLAAYFRAAWEAWNRFWFTPADPATLSLIRVLAGGMLFYTHFIWSFDLAGFLGADGYTPTSFLRDQVLAMPATEANPTPRGPWSDWSVFFWIHSTWLLWTVHLIALATFLCLFLGLFSRTMAVLGFLFAVSYVQRVTPGGFFGLDKTNCMLAMYLLVGPCGARYSLDRLWRLRKGKPADPEPSTSANLAVRLMQVHLCVMYLFSGLAKIGGPSWQMGTAVWWAAASYEYQSLDLTWLASWPVLVALATHVTVFWETFYCCLVWNRFARPIVLWIAMGVHGGIALFMGMITFGLAMIFANFAFLKPETVRRFVDPIASRVSLALVGRKVG
jgi:hypothetical protein